MEYQHTAWKHHRSDTPVEIYSELDEERWETRKVEVFADGGLRYSDGVDSTGTCDLSDQPLPPIDPNFENRTLVATAIDESAFERMWDRATGEQTARDQGRS